MHELAVTESILEIALRHARQVDATQITDLYLVIGQLSSIVDDSVQFYWDIIAKNTLAEGGRLHFKRIPAEFVCLDCSTSYALSDENLVCPGCGGVHVRVTAGEEFQLESMDVETTATPASTLLEK